MTLYLVNFVSPKRRGFGSAHRTLMSTEYRSHLASMRIKMLPHYDVMGEVITAVYWRKRWRRLKDEDLKQTLFKLVEYCKENEIKELLIPLQPIVVYGFSLEYLQSLLVVVFKDSGIEYKVG